MTFAEIVARVRKGVQRDDLVDEYPDFVNEALMEIQQKRSWSFMKTTLEPLTLLAGDKTVALPADFKEFQNIRPPVHLILEDPAQPLNSIYKPIEVVYEHEEQRRVWSFGGLVWTMRLFMERVGTTATLGMVVPAEEDINLRVKYFAYLPALVNDNDTSPFIDAFPHMVLSAAKQNAFSTINDPFKDQMEADFQARFADAVRQDAYSEVAGRELRM